MSLYSPIRLSTPKRKKGLRSVGKHWKSKPALIVYDDGREVCNDGNADGRKIYRARIYVMLDRQYGLCCNCRKPLGMNEATFEHENGRGAGKRDDRIEKDGKPINGASHALCNKQRGSKRTPIWHGELA